MASALNHSIPMTRSTPSHMHAGIPRERRGIRIHVGASGMGMVVVMAVVFGAIALGRRWDC